MNVVCIGAGYVGCLTAAAFAALGYPTTVVDVDPRRIALINEGKAPIYEPGLDLLLAEVAGKELSASCGFNAVRTADIVFICVGTPPLDNGSADLSQVKEAARAIGAQLNRDRFTVVVNKSTVPVGTAAFVSSVLEQASGLREHVHFSVVSNPEFLREGSALEDVFFPDRIVVGSDSPKAAAAMKRLYRPVLTRARYRQFMTTFGDRLPWKKPKPIYFETDTKSSEMIKYAANAFLAVKISYINEMARLCDALGTNVAAVARGMGMDSRIGPHFLQVSSGWSGSCFPKDTAELLAASEKYGRPLLLVKAAVESNESMLQYCVEKLRSRVQVLNGKTVGILGLTFKPDTDDARRTQASVIIRHITDMGAFVQVHDPQGAEPFRSLHPDLPVRYCAKAEETAAGAHALLLLTHWNEYLDLDWERMAGMMRNRYVLDCRNFLPGSRLADIGFHYEGLGIPSRVPTGRDSHISQSDCRELDQ